MNCKNCGKEILDIADFCPYCGTTTDNGTKKKAGKRPIYEKWWFWVLICFVLILFFPNKGESETNNNDSGSSSMSTTIQKTEGNTNPTVSEEDFKESCIIVDYKDLCRYPENYVGTNICIELEIHQIMDVGGPFNDEIAWRGMTDNDGSGFYFDDEYYLLDKRPEGSIKVLEDDILIVYGEFVGLEEIIRALTSTKEEIPCIEVRYIDILE